MRRAMDLIHFVVKDGVLDCAAQLGEDADSWAGQPTADVNQLLLSIYLYIKRGAQSILYILSQREGKK